MSGPLGKDGQSGDGEGARGWELVSAPGAAPSADPSGSPPRLSQRRELPPRVGVPRLVSSAAQKNPDFGRTLVGIPAADLPKRESGPARPREQRLVIDLLPTGAPPSGDPADTLAQPAPNPREAPGVAVAD